MKIASILASITIATAAIIPAAHAATPEELIRPIQDQWAEIKYKTPEKQQEEGYNKLAQQARKLAEQNPGVAEILVWEGIVLSSEAGAKGGLGALGLAKEAKAKLEEAMKLNDKALSGSAYTSLATLYAKVPGWPIGFGDEDKADQLLRQALQVNPEGIDSLYFWGDHLLRQGHYVEAKAALEKARQAAPRPGRELADSGRQGEIDQLLLEVNKKLN